MSQQAPREVQPKQAKLRVEKQGWFTKHPCFCKGIQDLQAYMHDELDIVYVAKGVFVYTDCPAAQLSLASLFERTNQLFFEERVMAI